jgi:hypothetical protein
MTVSTLTAIRGNVGSCREWIDEKNNVCGEPADFVLWGKLIRAEGLGPRCHDHAAKHVGHRALAPHSGYALVNLGELAGVLGNGMSLIVRKPTPGEQAYADWCDAPESDLARYWHRMNQADKAKGRSSVPASPPTGGP